MFRQVPVRAPVERLERILHALITADMIAPVITVTTVPARTCVAVRQNATLYI